MGWATGIIACVLLPLFLIAAIAVWWHGRPMRLRARRRAMIERYCRLEWR